ncbi:MAG TPA: hypothetical protein VHJ34_10940 [Actinomycetota bacterium]|nr:hypothetical protein [Actinomycetota bacterium]
MAGDARPFIRAGAAAASCLLAAMAPRPALSLDCGRTFPLKASEIQDYAKTADIIFSGRQIIRRYLGYSSRDVFHHYVTTYQVMEMFKGPASRQITVLHRVWCDGGCDDKKPVTRYPAGKSAAAEQIVLLSKPGKAMLQGLRGSYKGRIDGVTEPCGTSGTSVWAQDRDRYDRIVEWLRREREMP